MHELSIATELLRLCEKELEERPGDSLQAVRIAVGDLSSVEPELLRFAWQGLLEGGMHEGARLEIDWRPARQTCAGCGEIAERQPGSWLRLCPTCGCPLRVEGGDELDLLGVDTVRAATARDEWSVGRVMR